MVQDRLKSWLLSSAMAFAATLAIFYVAIVAESLLQPERRPASLSVDLGFRANDRDWDHVNDFWCGVPGLYQMTSVGIVDGPDPIRLIERSIEESDR